MSLRYLNVLPLAVVCLALAVAPAVAAEKAAPPVTQILGNAPVPDGTLNGVDCAIGVVPPGVFNVQFVFPPNDEYHTLLVPTLDCCVLPGGGMGPVALTEAHALLRWPTNCTIQVSVTILGATGPSNCLVPDPNNVICPPTTYQIDGNGADPVTFVAQHDFPLPAGCCIQGPAFLKIDFISNGTCPPNTNGLDAPRLVLDAAADPCVSYNFYPGNPSYFDLSAFFPNPVMWTNGHCCGATPTIPSTWGSVKSLYR